MDYDFPLYTNSAKFRIDVYYILTVSDVYTDSFIILMSECNSCICYLNTFLEFMNLHYDLYYFDFIQKTAINHHKYRCFSCLSLNDKFNNYFNKKCRMMFNFLTTFSFHRFFQSGMYFDYFYKKCSEIFVRNVLIYMAQFFGEKFMIEYWTKLLIHNTVFNLNRFISWTSLTYKWFFIQIVTYVIYSLLLVNLFQLFL